MGIEYEFDLHLDGIAGRVQAALTPAAMKAMEMIRVEVAQGTPVETGNLVGSEEVRPTVDGAEIYIPGPYARRQEYELSYHHNTGHALYLTLPMIQKADDALKMIAEDVRGVL
jgi:hypothetical protein